SSRVCAPRQDGRRKRRPFFFVRVPFAIRRAPGSRASSLIRRRLRLEARRARHQMRCIASGGISMTATTETRAFEAEVAQVLHLVTHSLYSHKDIFLRELVSNASDACDKLRFASLSDASLVAADAELRIEIAFDRDARTLTIRDNGIGMSRDEVIENVGTIARSGTRRFLESLSGDARKDTQLIGQFGVGFYSAFIVADKVVLETRKAGAPSGEGVRWESGGSGEYNLQTVELARRGTTVTLHL